jgi:hypothetical protein
MRTKHRMEELALNFKDNEIFLKKSAKKGLFLPYV